MITALIIIGAVALLLFVIHLLMGKEMRIVKYTTVNRPVKDIFEYIKITKNQDYFSTWNMTDPGMKKEYQGVDGEVGFIYKWDSENKNVGAGEQEIIKIQEGKSIIYDLRFIRPMKNVASSSFELSAENADQTKLTWIFSGPTRFPMSIMKPVFQRMLGKDLEKGLANLKTILEK